MKTNEIIYQHVYQNTVEGVLLFYDNSDRIVFFTILSVLSERYGIRIIAVSLMPDHYHLLVEANGRKQLENFIRTLNSVYAKAFNLTVHRKGKLFNRKYGCASKKTTKEIISAINYILNNPLVTLLDSKVESSRWNYLPYALGNNPFSDVMVPGKTRKQLMSAMKYVVTRRDDNRWLTYAMLKKLRYYLNATEAKQLEDYIISSYYRIDYQASAKFYGTMEKMIEAANYNSGSEYGISEPFETKDDNIYRDIANDLRQKYAYDDIKAIFSLGLEQRIALGMELQNVFICKSRQIEKYLQLKDGTLYQKYDRVVRVKSHSRHLAIIT